jgi:hypothetical protein
MLQAQPGQLRLGLSAGLEVDELRQPMPEAANDRDMPGTEVAVALRCRGRGQHRLQGFTVERATLAQVLRFMDPPGGLGAADPQPVSQRRGQPATQLGRIGLLGELVDQRVFDGRLLTAKALEPLQHRQPFRRGEHVEPQIQRALVGGFERVENLDDLLTATRTHVRIIASRSDNRRSYPQLKPQ